MSFSDTLNLGNKPASSWSNLSVNSIKSNLISCESLNTNNIINSTSNQDGVAKYVSKKLVASNLNKDDLSSVLTSTGIITSVQGNSGSNELSIRQLTQKDMPEMYGFNGCLGNAGAFDGSSGPYELIYKTLPNFYTTFNTMDYDENNPKWVVQKEGYYGIDFEVQVINRSGRARGSIRAYMNFNGVLFRTQNEKVLYDSDDRIHLGFSYNNIFFKKEDIIVFGFEIFDGTVIPFEIIWGYLNIILLKEIQI